MNKLLATVPLQVPIEINILLQPGKLFMEIVSSTRPPFGLMEAPCWSVVGAL